jgi:protein-L-isoaspartate O-methyltransferase
MDQLIKALHQLRSSMRTDEWHAYCSTVAKEHQIANLLAEDPFTRRSIQKPRGYSGDAQLIDYIYLGLLHDEEAVTSLLGRRIFSYTAGVSASARAVRARCQLLATTIDATAIRSPSPQVLALACGHLHEASLSSAVKDGKLLRYVAVDQDQQSLAEVSRRFPEGRVTPVQASVKDLLRGRVSLDSFDLIYCAGLYDYLPDNVSIRLTNALLGMLNHGGRLLIGNFVPSYETSGYMEAFMDWHLICRTTSQMSQLLTDIQDKRISEVNVYADQDGYIAYLDLLRA